MDHCQGKRGQEAMEMAIAGYKRCGQENGKRGTLQGAGEVNTEEEEGGQNNNDV